MGTRRRTIAWTDRMDSIILESWANGTPTQDIAQRLHVSDFSVRRRADALGLKSRGNRYYSQNPYGVTLQSATAMDNADRAATIEFELAYCDWADRHNQPIYGYRASA
jgi:hypothetical protein